MKGVVKFVARCENVTDEALRDLSEALEEFVNLKKADIDFAW